MRFYNYLQELDLPSTQGQPSPEDTLEKNNLSPDMPEPDVDKPEETPYEELTKEDKEKLRDQIVTLIAVNSTVQGDGPIKDLQFKNIKLVPYFNKFDMEKNYKPSIKALAQRGLIDFQNKVLPAGNTYLTSIKMNEASIDNCANFFKTGPIEDACKKLHAIKQK